MSLSMALFSSKVNFILLYGTLFVTKKWKVSFKTPKHYPLFWHFKKNVPIRQLKSTFFVRNQTKIKFTLVYPTFFVTKKWKVSFQNTKPLSAFLTLEKKCPHSLLKIHIFRQKSTKIKFTLVYWPFFLLEFSRFSPKSSIKICSFFLKSNLR